MRVVDCKFVDTIIHRIQLNIGILTVISCQNVPINLINDFFDGEILTLAINLLENSGLILKDVSENTSLGNGQNDLSAPNKFLNFL